ncbi:unnamed protein product [Phytophthora fragariaefolia]|uniref:Unnamed protein product n=1 Tax=Phytophthora fragariaefolia TaxID=1490495 RepID=A0A9W6TUB8_9STRA|nr:unnamed protein product [Phytophthora fragariaefolia]
MDSLQFLDFMGGSPMAPVSTSDKSLWAQLVRTANRNRGDGLMKLLSAFSAARLAEYRDEHQRSVTHLAILEDDLELLEFVLESGSPLNAPDDCGASPLTTALIGQHYQAADMLVAYGCDVDHTNSTLQTSMHVLVTHGASGAVRWLIERGADIEACDVGGNSPLHLAAAYCSLPVVELLLAAGANVNTQNESKATPMHFAAPNGNCAVIEGLIKYGGDVNARDGHGNTPLIGAAFVSQTAEPHFASGDQTTQYAVAKLLLQHGAEVNAVNNDGDSALFGAVSKEFDSLVKLLLANEADACVRNNLLETPLHALARGYTFNLAIWRELLQHQADVYAQDQRNLTCAMVWASRHQGFPVPGEFSNGDSTQTQDIAQIEHAFSRECALGRAH